MLLVIYNNTLNGSSKGKSACRERAVGASPTREAPKSSVSGAGEALCR